MIEILEDLPQYVAFRDQVGLEHCRVCNAIPSMCSHNSVLDDDCILVRDAVSMNGTSSVLQESKSRCYTNIDQWVQKFGSLVQRPDILL
jgi:hypothetical protein